METERINAGRLKRIYLACAITCCAIHVIVFVLLLYLDALLLDMRTIRYNSVMLIASLLSIYFMSRVSNGVVEIPHKTKRFNSNHRKKSILCLFVFSIINLFVSYFHLILELNQLQDSIISTSTMSLVVVVIAIIHAPLIDDSPLIGNDDTTR